jgi:methylglutaconyl-CoA hydratase
MVNNKVNLKKNKHQIIMSGGQEQQVRFSIDDYGSGKVATVTLNRPRRGNALTAEMGHQLLSIFDHVDSQYTEIRVLVLTGAGKYFCTGMDLQMASNNEISQSSDDEDNQDTSVLKFQQMFSRLANLKIPTLCVLNGPALGGGVGLFFACDIRISTRADNYVCLAESKRGLVPALISPWIVAELGKGLAMEMMIGGYRVSAEKLHSLGILSMIVGKTGPLSTPPPSNYALEVSSKSSVEETVKYYTEMLISSAPVASQMIKKLVRHLGVESVGWEGKLEYVRKLFPQMMANQEAAYGMMAFLQKEKPNWSEFHLQNQSKL